MKITSASVAALMLCLATPALAKERSSVQFPDTATVEGKSLTLNGVGLRTKAIFKVYVAGLYTETASKDAAKVIATDEVKRVRMHMLRDLEKAKIVDAIRDGFEKNNKAQFAALKTRLDRFVSVIPDLKKGDELLLTYAPGKGTTISSKSGQTLSVAGKDFADALFSVWLGANPVDEDLRDEMLGR